MSDIYFYKVAYDEGGAPCVRDGMLSLAICKPAIRATAQKGALLFGFAATGLWPDNRLIYAAVVTERLEGGSYYRNSRYWKRPDCIYRWVNNELAIQPNPFHTQDSLARDVGPPPQHPRAMVLLSDDFRYFGGNGSAEYKRVHPALAEVISRLKQGHRRNHSPAIEKQLLLLKEELWTSGTRKRLGRSSQLQDGTRRADIRGRSC